MHEESGLTLIELLVTTSIIAILGALSVQNYALIKQRTYDSARDSLIRNARTALEASRGNRDTAADEWFWVTSTDAGTLQGFYWSSDGGGGPVDGKDILPGLSVSKDTRITASLDTSCENNNFEWCAPGALCCIMQSIMAYHCKGNVVKNVLVWNTGEVWEMQFAGWGC